jgi:hypothetical protein
MRTYRTYFITAFILASVVFVACKKENDTNILDAVQGIKTNKPMLVTSADTLFFNGSDEKELIITTNPFTEITYGIFVDINLPWLVLSKYDGHLKTSPDTIHFSTDFSNTAPGIYEGYIEIVSSVGNKNIYIRGISGYSVPDSLRFNPFENTKSVSIANVENKPLDYSIAFSNNYVSTTAPSGTLPAGQISAIPFTVNRTGMTTGDYTTMVYVTVNNKTDTIHVTVESYVPQKLMLTSNVTDAEYTKAKDWLVYISGSTSKLFIYNTNTATTASVDLVYTPTCVSVSSDGSKAVVGHNGYITYVNLTTASVIQSYPVSCYALDVVLGDNNWTYVFPREDQWEKIRCINLNISAANETLHTGPSIYAGTKARMHPSGTSLYTADNGLSPSDLEKMDIQNGTATFLYDSPYHGQYEVLGDLWFSEDGSRIFTRGRNVFRTSVIKEEDMLFDGKIELDAGNARIMWLDHSSAKNNLYVISSSIHLFDNENMPYLNVFNATNLVRKQKRALEKYLSGTTLYEAEPRFAFSNALGSHVFVITKTAGTQIAEQWAIEKLAID